MLSEDFLRLAEEEKQGGKDRREFEIEIPFNPF